MARDERETRKPERRGGEGRAGGKRRGEGAEEAPRIDRRRGVFMISVAAELSDMHPQTLRMYEARGLITPKRSPKNTRLYSFEDVERLRRIQRMTAEEGLNLAGVENVLRLERELERTRSEVGRMRERAAELEREMLEEIERVKRSFRAEIVPYGAYDVTGIKPPASFASSRRGAAGHAQDETKPIKIPVERRRRQGRDAG